MSLFATQTALTMKEPTGWHSASMTKVRVCTLTLMDYHWPVDITVHYLLSTSLLAAAWRRLSTGWRNTVMTRLKLCGTNTDEMINGLGENGLDEMMNDEWT